MHQTNTPHSQVHLHYNIFGQDYDALVRRYCYDPTGKLTTRSTTSGTAARVIFTTRPAT